MTAEQDAKAIAALLNQGEAKKALKQARIAIKRYPRTAFFMNLAGLALSTSGQPRDAIKYFQDAVKTQPEFPDAHRNLAQTLVLIGQPDKAVTVLKRHLARSPKDAEAEYLVNFVNQYLKNDISRKDIVWTYSGVRPLYDDGASTATAATRDYVLSGTYELEVATSRIPAEVTLAPLYATGIGLSARMACTPEYFSDMRATLSVMPVSSTIGATRSSSMTSWP